MKTNQYIVQGYICKWENYQGIEENDQITDYLYVGWRGRVSMGRVHGEILWD